MTEYAKSTKLDKILESMASPRYMESAARGRFASDKMRDDIYGLRNDQLRSQELVKRIEKKISERKSRSPKLSTRRAPPFRNGLPDRRAMDVVHDILASLDREAIR